MKRAALIIAGILTLLPLVSAQLGLNLSVNPTKVNLHHDQIGEVNASLSPASTVCSLNCDYTLTLQDTTQAANIFEKDPSQTTRLGPIGVQAPPLTPSYGRRGEQTYTLTVQCQERPQCGTNAQELTEDITVKYNLTDQQRRQYNNLTDKINAAEDQINTLNDILDDIQNSINAAPENAITQPIRTDVQDLRNETNRFQDTVEQARTNRDELQFRFGLQAFQPRFLNALNTTEDSMQRVKQRFANRLQRHEKTAKKINNLIDTYEDYHEQAARLNVNDQRQQTQDSLQSLHEIFTAGKFEAYQSVEQRIRNVNTTIQKLINKTGRAATKTKSRIDTTLTQELNTTCNTSPTCNVTPPSTNGSIQSTLPRICTFLTETMPDKYDEANTKRNNTHQAKKSETRSRNDQIQRVNKEITALRPILNNITTLTQNNYVTPNATPCHNAINHINTHDIPTVDDVTQARQTCTQVLNETQDLITTEQSPWAYIEYWVSDIFTSYTVTFNEPRQREQRSLPTPPQPFKRSNTTTTFTQTYCDEPNVSTPPSTVATLQ